MYEKRNGFDIKQTVLIIIIGVILVASGIFAIGLLRVRQVPASLRQGLHEESHERILQSGRQWIIAVHYPHMKNANAQKDLEIALKTEIDAFKAEHSSDRPIDKDQRAILYIDYDYHVVSDQYESVVLYKALGQSTENLVLNLDKIVNYDHKGAQIDLDELFTGEWLKQLAALFRRNMRKDLNFKDRIDNRKFALNTLAETDNYHMFSLDNDRLRIYYESERLLLDDQGLIHVDIDLNDMAFYLKQTLASDPEIRPSETDTTFVRYIDPNKPMVALTFDDGPTNDATGKILDVLATHKSAGTFFLAGYRIDSYNSMILREISEGHEIACHSFAHKSFISMDLDQYRQDLNKFHDAFSRIAPDYEITLLRPPFGSVNTTIQQNSPYILVLWSVDSMDWKLRDKTSVSDIVLSEVKDGSVILMHDLYTETAAAADIIVPALVENGYQLVTVSELIEYKGLTLKDGDIFSATYLRIR